MPRLHERNYAKERHWRKVFADWEISALTGAEYCRQHNISYTQFQDWRKTLARRKAEAEVRTAELQREHRSRLAEARKEASGGQRRGTKAGTSISPAVRGRARAAEVAKNGSSKASSAKAVEFAEVRLTNHEKEEIRFENRGASLQAGLEIVLCNSIIVRIQPGCQMELLSSVVSLLENRYV